jgi:hypothetical protein
MISPVLKDISRPDDSTIEEKSCQVGNPLSLCLLEGGLSGLGFEPLGNGEKDLPTAKAVRPTERARASPFNFKESRSRPTETVWFSR